MDAAPEPESAPRPEVEQGLEAIPEPKVQPVPETKPGLRATPVPQVELVLKIQPEPQVKPERKAAPEARPGVKTPLLPVTSRMFSSRNRRNMETCFIWMSDPHE